MKTRIGIADTGDDSHGDRIELYADRIHELLKPMVENSVDFNDLSAIASALALQAGRLLGLIHDSLQVEEGEDMMNATALSINIYNGIKAGRRVSRAIKEAQEATKQ